MLIFVHRAMMRSGQTDYTPTYIKEKLKRRESLLWVLLEAEKKLLHAAMTTEVCRINGGRRVCLITSFAADSLNLCYPFLEDIHRYARGESCEAVRLYGRYGWIRELKKRGYEQPWIALEKRL